MLAQRLGQAINWKHAFGELILIAAGILLALAASDLYEDRVERQEEIEALQEIRIALESDNKTLAAEIAHFEGVVAKLDRLLAHLDAESPYDPSLDEAFGAAYALRLIRMNTSPYESLKSTGLKTVSNRKLRTRLIELYDQDYSNLEGMNEIQVNIILEALRPYFLEHFQDLDFGTSATPISYDYLKNDQRFRNLIDYRSRAIFTAQLASYPLTAKRVQALIEAIDEEIGKGSD